MRLAFILLFASVRLAYADQNPAGNTCAATTMCTATFASNVGVGSLVVVVCGASAGARTFTVTNTDGVAESTWTQAKDGQTVGGAATRSVGMSYAYNTGGGWVTPQCTVSGAGTTVRIIATEVVAIGGVPWTANPLSTVAARADSGTSTTPSSGNITTSASSVVFGAAISITARTWSLGGAYLHLIQEPSGVGAGVLGSEYNTIAPGTFDVDFTLSGTSNWGAIGAAFTIPTANGAKRLPVLKVGKSPEKPPADELLAFIESKK